MCLHDTKEMKSKACCLATQSCPPDTKVGSTPCSSYTINETVAHVACDFKGGKETAESCTKALSDEYKRIKADLTKKASELCWR